VRLPGRSIASAGAALREWLSRRYRNTRAAAPHLGGYWLHHILNVVIGAGTWESATVPILALARMGDEKRGSPALADVFADAEALAPPWAPGVAATWSEHYLERPGESGVWRTTTSPWPWPVAWRSPLPAPSCRTIAVRKDVRVAYLVSTNNIHNLPSVTAAGG
jgi:hypothetical protein